MLAAASPLTDTSLAPAKQAQARHHLLPANPRNLSAADTLPLCQCQTTVVKAAAPKAHTSRARVPQF